MTKVMLVEDDNNLREIYEARLLAEGYDIVTAKDGEEALAMAVKEKPDLIISDVMMPKISGFDMLDILRSTPETKNTKVIMMTALSQAEDKIRADKLGADKYLVKSQVTLEDVARAAREVISGETTPPPVQEETPEVQSPEPVNTTPQPAPAMPDPLAVAPPVVPTTIQPTPPVPLDEPVQAPPVQTPVQDMAAMQPDPLVVNPLQQPNDTAAQGGGDATIIQPAPGGAPPDPKADVASAVPAESDATPELPSLTEENQIVEDQIHKFEESIVADTPTHLEVSEEATNFAIPTTETNESQSEQPVQLPAPVTAEVPEEAAPQPPADLSVPLDLSINEPDVPLSDVPQTSPGSVSVAADPYAVAPPPPPPLVASPVMNGSQAVDTVVAAPINQPAATVPAPNQPAPAPNTISPTVIAPTNPPSPNETGVAVDAYGVAQPPQTAPQRNAPTYAGSVPIANKKVIQPLTDPSKPSFQDILAKQAQPQVPTGDTNAQPAPVMSSAVPAPSEAAPNIPIQQTNPVAQQTLAIQNDARTIVQEPRSNPNAPQAPPQSQIEKQVPGSQSPNQPAAANPAEATFDPSNIAL